MIRHIAFLSTNGPGPQMGMGHYERLISKALILNSSNPARPRCEFSVVYDGRPRGFLAPEVVQKLGYTSARRTGFSVARLKKLPWLAARSFSRLAAGSKPTLYHSLDLRFPAPGHRPSIYTVHDLPPARFDDEGTLPLWGLKAAFAAERIVTPSHFAKREIIELLGVDESRVQVIHNGCETDVFHPEVPLLSQAQRSQWGLSGPYLVYVGGATRRKNIAALLQAWPGMRQEYPELQLALVGPRDRFERLVDQAEHTSGVVIIGYAGRDTLPRIVRTAEAMVYPSIYEGFGLPPLEALAMGTPVVAVHQGALPEVVGNLAWLAPDGTADCIADAVINALRDQAFKSRVRLEGPAHAGSFSWQRHGESLLDLYCSFDERTTS